MHVHPDIAALRSDRAPQRKAQAAMQAAVDRWRTDPDAAAMLGQLRAFGEGAPLEACPTLERIFTGPRLAESLCQRLAACFCTALAANPYGHPPFRNGFDGRAGSILLARSGRAQLLLQSREPGEDSLASYMFSDALRYDAVLGGEAEARLVRRRQGGDEQADFDHEVLHLRSGHRLALDLASETLEIVRVAKRLVVLRLLRAAESPGPSREYEAATGALAHQSAGNLATSRQEAIVALLGRMDRADAAPTLAGLARGDGDASLRWQALRECLTLDTAQGFAALVALARRSDDPLAAPAGALRAQLLEAHPQLRQLETKICPA